MKRLNVTNNFEVHSIEANQLGKTIFGCQASYQRKEESSLFHERTMPSAPGPETLLSQNDILEHALKDCKTPACTKEIIRAALNAPIPIDVKRDVNITFSFWYTNDTLFR